MKRIELILSLLTQEEYDSLVNTMRGESSFIAQRHIYDELETINPPSDVTIQNGCDIAQAILDKILED